MTKKVHKFIPFLFLFSISFSHAADGDRLDFKDLIRLAKAKAWTAVENRLTRLTLKEQKAFLGAPPIEKVENIGLNPPKNKTEAGPRVKTTANNNPSPEAPAEFRWDQAAFTDGRQIRLSPVKNQGQCQSCVAFSLAAVLEDNLIAYDRVPRGGGFLSVSPQYIFSCGNPPGGCGSGMQFDSAANVALSGVTDEQCTPYYSADQQDYGCSQVRCAEWQSRLHRFNGGGIHSNTFESIKDAVVNRGPVLTRMNVYQDFFAYGGGVYSHASGALAGGHGVSIIGYSTAGRYWVIKNSWGPDWGEQGYFKISWDDSVTGIGGSIWQFNPI